MSPFRSLISTVFAFVVATAGLVHAGETWHVMKFRVAGPPSNSVGVLTVCR